MIASVPKVGVSACLLGEPVRYDGGHKKHTFVSTILNQYLKFVPFCPELAIGLGTPRQAIRLVDSLAGTRCVGSKSPDLDVTDALRQAQRQHEDVIDTLSGYIVKQGSPSCGMQRVQVYHNGTPRKSGVGVFTQALIERYPYLPVEEEGRLCDPMLRENFLQRVYALSHWKILVANGQPSYQMVRDFHCHYTLLLMSHDEPKALALTRWLDGHNSLESLSADDYLMQFMAIMAIHTSKQKQVSVLTTMVERLSHRLLSTEQQSLMDTIADYTEGSVPLIVPVSLLNHYYRDEVDMTPDIVQYLSPYPKRLGLMNHL